MLTVICDSSTLIHLASINRLGLLRAFYSEIIVPTAVWREVVIEGQERAGVSEVRAAREEGWLNVASVSDERVLQLLKRDLHPGEAEVITLALEKQAALVLLDETEARRMADINGLNKTGVIGILIRAKLENKVDTLRAELNALRQQGGFWIDEGLYQQAVEAVGE